MPRTGEPRKLGEPEETDETHELVSPTAKPIYKEEPQRWVMLILYCIILSVSYGGLGPIGVSVDSSQTYYDLDNFTFNFVYLCAFADFAISMMLWSWILDAYGLRIVVLVSCSVMVGGYVMQLFYKTEFWLVVFGGALVDTARAMIWSTSTTFIARWFSSSSKSLAYGIIFAVAASFSVGLFLSVRLVISSPADFEDEFIWFVVALLILSASTLLVAVFVFHERPDHPPGPQTIGKNSETKERPCGWMCTPCRASNRSTTSMYLAVYLASVMGTWSAASLLLQIMDDHDYTHGQITTVGIIYAIFSLPTPLITGFLMDTTRDYRSVVIGMIGAATIGFSMFYWTIDRGWPFYMAIAVMSLSTGSYSISFAVCTTELAYPLPEKNVSMFMFFWAQFAGAAGTVLASFASVVTTALLAFLVIYFGCTLVLVTNRFTPVTYGRLQAAERESRQLDQRYNYVETTTTTKLEHS